MDDAVTVDDPSWDAVEVSVPVPLAELIWLGDSVDEALRVALGVIDCVDVGVNVFDGLCVCDPEIDWVRVVLGEGVMLSVCIWLDEDVSEGLEVRLALHEGVLLCVMVPVELGDWDWVRECDWEGLCVWLGLSVTLGVSVGDTDTDGVRVSVTEEVADPLGDMICVEVCVWLRVCESVRL